MGKAALDVNVAEAAKGGSRSGWALCQLMGSSYPPTKQEMERNKNNGEDNFPKVNYVKH